MYDKISNQERRQKKVDTIKKRMYDFIYEREHEFEKPWGIDADKQKYYYDISYRYFCTEVSCYLSSPSFLMEYYRYDKKYDTVVYIVEEETLDYFIQIKCEHLFYYIFNRIMRRAEIRIENEKFYDAWILGEHLSDNVMQYILPISEAIALDKHGEEE